MKKFVPIFALALIFGFAAELRGQQSITAKQVTTQQLTLNAQTPVAAPVQVTVTPNIAGNATYYYWIVTHTGGEISAPAGPFLASNAPASLGGIYHNSIAWTPVVAGATYDLLRTSTSAVPTGACNCAVGTALTNTSFTDGLSSTTSYTVGTSTDQVPLICTNVTGCGVSSGGAANQSPTYIFSVTGGTTKATPYGFQGGALPSFTNTDAAVVVNQVLAQLENVGGRLYFTQGTYNFNSATQENTGGFTNFYCVGLPNSGSLVFPIFSFEGETTTTDFSSTTKAGVIFNVTSSAITAAGSSVLAAFWVRPNLNNTLGYYFGDRVTFKNVEVLFPNNTRGKEIGIDGFTAGYLRTDTVGVDFVTAVSVASAAGNEGIVSPPTPGDGGLIQDTIVHGFDTGIEVNAEGFTINRYTCFQCNAAVYYGKTLGLTGGTGAHITHPSIWSNFNPYDCKIGIIIGGKSNLASQPRLDIQNFDLEYTTTGPWIYQAGIVALEPGNVTGIITWSQTLTNTGRGTLTTPFAPGSEQGWTIENQQASTGGPGMNSTLTETATNGLTLGGARAWDNFIEGSMTNFSVLNGTFSVSGSGVVTGTTASAFNFAVSGKGFGAADQISTIGNQQGTTGGPAVVVRVQDKNNFYWCTPGDTVTAPQIGKTVAGTPTVLATGGTIVFAAGISTTLTAQGSTLACLINGVQQVTTTDSTFTTAGQGPGFYIFGNTGTNTIDFWSGGNLDSVNLTAGFNGNGLNVPGALKIECANGTPVTVSSTTSETNLMTCTIPAGDISAIGQDLHIRAAGTNSNSSAANANYEYRLYLDATVIGDTGVQSVTGDKNTYWTCDADLIFSAVGSSGSAKTDAQIWDELNTNGLSFPPGATSSTQTFNTTTSHTIKLTVQPGTSAATVAPVENRLVVERLGP